MTEELFEQCRLVVDRTTMVRSRRAEVSGVATNGKFHSVLTDATCRQSRLFAGTGVFDTDSLIDEVDVTLYGLQIEPSRLS